uniref:NADH dehydrogenase subunit 4L n=1 Tax=Aphelenchoides medicagus TaxID=2306573 RepID=UPI001F1495BA|nr:NADH dehydrogenase subunit 4L [Aphelenchoides medicagus]UKS08879.1 NADH dehydrogenase subunit 4L [Aphelenchoides medicagus]
MFLFISMLFFIFKNGRFIFLLISLEFLMMSLFFYFFNFLGSLMFFFFIVLSVVSSILGMLMMISLVKYFGSDKVIF